MIIRKTIALIALCACLGLVNWSIYKKEQHLKHGRAVFLELAPVDPRSLMQGDFMALRFKMGNQITDALQNDETHRLPYVTRNADGYAIVSLDEKNIGEFSAIYDQQQLAPNQTLMRFRQRNGDLKFATNAFFFQEGHAERYEPAKYGLFRVDANGELLLVSLHNDNLENLALVTP